MSAEQLPAIRQPKANVQAGGAVAAIVPQTLDECFRVSQAIAISGLAPRGIDKPEQIMVAIMAGAELGLAPFQSLQSFAVVNGRPTLWGDGLIAVVRARGVKVRETLEGDGDDMVARCVATRPDTGEEIERAYTVADAKRAGLWGKQGPWQQHPKRMLQMRARAFTLRDGCADMLRGIQVREEVEDYQPIRDVTPAKSGLMERLPGASNGEGFAADVVEQAIPTEQPLKPEEINEILDGDTVPNHDPETGEIIDAEIEAAGEATDDDGPATPDDAETLASEAPEAAAQPSEPSTKSVPLSERVAAFKKRCDEARTTVKMQSIWNASVDLRKDLDAKDPEELPALEKYWSDRYAVVEAAEQA